MITVVISISKTKKKIGVLSPVFTGAEFAQINSSFSLSSFVTRMEASSGVSVGSGLGVAVGSCVFFMCRNIDPERDAGRIQQ